MDDRPPLPRVTPYLLRSAAHLCPRRLDRDVAGERPAQTVVGRGRVRDAFLASAREAHLDFGVPGDLRTPADLVEEEQLVFRQAAHWYRQLFGERPVRIVDEEYDAPTPLTKRAIRLGGWVDLVLEAPDGVRELRQLDFWGGPEPAADPLELASVLSAVLRVAVVSGSRAPMRVCWSDLVHGLHHERMVDLGAELADLGKQLDGLLDDVDTRRHDPVAVPGTGCASCGHVRGCPALGGQSGARDRTRRDDPLPAVLGLTPSSLELWHRCPRAWRNRELLSLPASDEPSTAHHGRLVHDVLRFLHERGTCHDPNFVEEVLDSHGADARLRDEITRHERRCPSPAYAIGHELGVAQFWGRPGPPFVAAARLDVVWEHDGVLDVRDYKTGRVVYERVADDPRARLQAWAAAPLAAARGLRVQVRYEHLSAEVREDPEPWEPDGEELDAVGRELYALASSIRAARNLSDFAGVADADVCSTCQYRSICPDSAAPAAPAWPRVDDEAAEPL